MNSIFSAAEISTVLIQDRPEWIREPLRVHRPEWIREPLRVQTRPFWSYENTVIPRLYPCNGLKKIKLLPRNINKNHLDRFLIHRNHLWSDLVVRRLISRPEGSARSIMLTACRIRTEKITFSMIRGFEISREHISIIDREVKITVQRGLEALITTRNVRVGRSVSWYCM